MGRWGRASLSGLAAMSALSVSDGFSFGGPSSHVLEELKKKKKKASISKRKQAKKSRRNNR